MNEYDEILFEKASRGDIQAFEAFIMNYEKLIYNAAYRMLLNPSDAQDIAQEVLIKVYKNIAKCKSAGAFKSWLFRIVHNACIDEIRKRKGKYSVSLDESPESEEGTMENQLLRDENTPETTFFSKVNHEEIEKAISKLSDEYRAVIVYRDINGLTYDEIASATGVALGTVKSRIARARSILKEELKKAGNLTDENTSNK